MHTHAYTCIYTCIYTQVIEKLSLAGQGGHVPYRNSKLTRLLQDSLGGNSRCAILVTVRTEAQNLDESIATLRLARRAAVVKTVEKKNEVKVRDPTKLFDEISNLSGQLEAQQDAVLQLQSELSRQKADEKAGQEELVATLEKYRREEAAQREKLEAMQVTCSLTHLLTHSLAHALTCSLAHLLTHSLAHALTHLLTHSLTHSLTH